MKKIILIIFTIVFMATFVCAEGIDENTVLMLHMDDSGLSDSSDSNHAVTLNGDAALNTGTYKFGSGSAYFDGNGDYLSIPDSDDWDFGTGDFTLDVWGYLESYSEGPCIMGRMLYSSPYPGYYWDVTGGKLTFHTDDNTIIAQSSNDVPLNTWIHLAVVKNGSSLTLYINGNEDGSGSISTIQNYATDLTIGHISPGGYVYNWNGYLDEIRISKGIARWTSDFTPPTAPYSAPPPAPFTCSDTVSYEGQDYSTVLIGEQCWFAENLNVGTRIDGVTTSTNNAVIEKYCYGDLDTNCFTEGGLYQWDEMMQYVTTEGAQCICPSGWHIPTDAEQHTLDDYLDTGTCDPARVDLWDCAIAGDKLKTTANCFGGVSCGTSGFEGLLAGYRDTDGSFGYRGRYTVFWSSLESGTDAWRRVLDSTRSTVHRSVYTKARGFSVRCLYDGASTAPTTSNFTSTETTNFSDVADITNVTNLTLAVPDKGKIKFPESTEINAENEDYDTNIVIEDEFISVNTAALDESFNTSATITLEGVTCPVETITYQEGTFTTKDDIIAGGSNCELEGVCSNIQCTGTTLTFDVAHFTGFAAGADANLTTEAQAGVFYPLDPIEFTAEYINSTDGTPISGECNITFDDDTEYTMDFDTDYNYTKSFATSGIHEYNVTCSSANFVTLEANDTKLVSSVDIPEFSMITLGLGLIAVLIGLFVIRRKK